MAPNREVNGDTASLKRKREPKDDPTLSQKKHRRRSNQQQGTVQQPDGDLEIPDATSAYTGVIQQRIAPWKLSKPMGGRMLDIDPIFSPDERLVKEATKG